MTQSTPNERRTSRRKKSYHRSGKVIAFTIVGILLSLFAAFLIMRGVFHLTSDNAALYYLRNPDGSVEVTNHLRPDESGNVERMIDFSYLFKLFAKTQATIGVGNIELTWNEKDGDGVIKEFRPDGTELLIVLARYANDEGTPQGLFIGGDLPLGDTERSSEASNNNTGVAFYNGTRWNHIWCSLNEGVVFSEGPKVSYEPSHWKYLGSTVLKSSIAEVVLQSTHELNTTIRGSVPVKMFMKRTLQKKRGEDYLLLKVELMNQGATPFAYSYEIGDEPWVGDFFRGSRGNVGWTDGEIYKYEGYVHPYQHTFVGYWDIGNDVIHEQGEFTGYADFMEWLSGPPTFVYFANDFGFNRINEMRPLSSWNNRVVSLLWLNQTLRPGEKKEYLLALGMAKPGYQNGAYFPQKPVVRRSID